MKTKIRLLAAFVSLLFIIQNVGPSLAMASENETSEEPSFVLVNDETGESIELTQSELETLLSESTDVIDQQENTDTVDSSLEASTDESVIEPSEEDNIPSEMSETTTTITEELPSVAKINKDYMKSEMEVFKDSSAEPPKIKPGMENIERDSGPFNIVKI